MQHRVLISCVAAIAFLMGFLVYGLVSNWPCVKHSFLFVKVTDIIQIVTLFIIAFFVTHYVSIKTSNKINRKEAALEIVLKFQSCIEVIYQSAFKYLSDPKSGSDLENAILLDLRSANNYLSMIQELKQDKSKVDELNLFDENYSKQRLFDLKISITDSPFKTQNHVYSPDQIISFHRNYLDLISSIYKFRTQFWL